MISGSTTSSTGWSHVANILAVARKMSRMRNWQKKGNEKNKALSHAGSV
ncbi:Hypothetical protein DEACI_4146 [Acididesulfobacillus acetoxydans]|uniref:Uncharacterized protein n=1 Tax=Acididesulfobacillus acetoxydans TaxID=1561005 RepID=A0A8S0VYR8_9FIRM|nr:Hypothetical protein DEACI_4146 [Acididesulfobacillus acetoxydans]CEJ09666.1 Hypothetical protein DEACI_4151 [Acididesulfobacillus acetoxydans]